MPSPFIPTYDPSYNSLSKTFKTHLNYIKCMDRLTRSLQIVSNVSTNSLLDKNKIIKLEALVRITEVSIDGEKNACDSQKAYAQVASPWIPVKCYYYLYYLESIFLYLINGSESGFSHGGHSSVKREILSLIKSNQITLVGTYSSSLSTVTTWFQADSFKTTGSTLSPNYYTLNDCDDSLKGKIAEYIEIDWKQCNKIKNYKKTSAKNNKVANLLPKEFCLLDYFYWMRIKSNYRDVDFLDFDNDVNENDAFEYLTYYIKATYQYAKALKTVIESIKQSRGMV